MSNSAEFESVVQSQLQSLDDTDAYASVWADALSTAADSSSSSSFVKWGGRGRGGRGLSRRTFQPRTIVVEEVDLQYVSDTNLSQKDLLVGATLKLLPGRVYSLVGINGCGKSTLLRRMDAGLIPGFPTHTTSCMYIPQEVLPDLSKTALETVLIHHEAFTKRSSIVTRTHITDLENELENLELEDNEEVMESLCDRISELEDSLSEMTTNAIYRQAAEALQCFGIHEEEQCLPLEKLSGGQRKKIVLSACLFCDYDLLLLDEPTNYLDIEGLLELRQLIIDSKQKNATVLLVSHDVDLINDVTTDIIHFDSNKTLQYYPGTYRDFVGYRSQRTLHHLRRNALLEKKRNSAIKTIDTLKKQPVPKRGAGAKKKSRQIESRKKKLEKMGLETNEKGHRWTAQNSGSGIRTGSINSVDASSRSKLSHAQLLKLKETNVLSPVPDKAVQFIFRNTPCTFGEPLLMAMDVGFGYQNNHHDSNHLLFDCVDMCLDESTITCILGANGSGKSTLLRLFAKKLQPTDGTIHHASNIKLAYLDQHESDQFIETYTTTTNNEDGVVTTPLLLLSRLHPNKKECELRAELTGFGLVQHDTNIRFLSGGERTRLCLTNLLLSDPDVLFMDEPTSHLDVESVEALVYGLSQWNGTIVMVSHDTNLIRCLGGNCYVILKDRTVRSIPQGIDFYLQSFSSDN